MNTLQTIYDSQLVAVIRGATVDNIVPIAEALQKGGIHILEITAETPHVLAVIEQLSTQLGDQVSVGAGTVLDPATARATIMAGATFVFSPTVNVATIQMTKRYGAVSIPGAMTPTEILTAYENGADMVKVFPAGVLGPDYFKNVQGPLPQIPLMPTGGINLNNIRDYFAKGAVAAGLGSSLVNTKQTMDEQALADITKKAEQFVAQIQ